MGQAILCRFHGATATKPARVTAKAWGVFYLIYGNAEDGSEIIADHTDNEFCNRLADAVTAPA